MPPRVPAPNKETVDFPFRSVVVDTTIIERSSSYVGTYQPLEPGSAYPNTNHSEAQAETYAGLQFLGQKAGQDPEFQERVWATPPHTQDIYNYNVAYSQEGNAFPAFKRRYLELRDTYSPRTKLQPLKGIYAVQVTAAGANYTNPLVTITDGAGGTGATAIALVSPVDGSITKITIKAEGDGYSQGSVAVAISDVGGSGAGATAVAIVQPTTCVLTAEETGDAPAPYDSLYLLVTRLYETLPGPILSTRQLLPNERGLALVTQKQYVAHGTVSSEITGAGVTSLSILNGGTGFTPGTYDFGSSGGGGTGFTGTYTVGTFTANVIVSATVTNGGAGYTTPPTVTIVSASGSGGIINALLTPTTIRSVALLTTDSTFQYTPTVTFSDTTGSGLGAQADAILTSTTVDSIPVTTGGSGYTAPMLTISAPDVSGGTQATATVNLTGDVITSITITNAGSGYTKTPTTVLSDSTGSGAVIGTAVLTATTVASIVLRATGSNYQSPTIAISDTITGATATASVQLAPTSVQSLFVANGGSGYTTSVSLLLSGGGGSGATGTASKSTGVITSVAITDAGINYTSPPTLTTPSGGGSGAQVVAAIGFLTYVDVDEVSTCKDLVQRTTIDSSSIPASIKYPISMRIDRQDTVVDSLVVLSSDTGGTAVGLVETAEIGGSGPALVYDHVDYMTDSQLAAYAATIKNQFSITGQKFISTLVYETIQPSGAPQIWTFRTTPINEGTSVGILDLTYEVKPFGINKVHTIRFEP